MAEEGKKSEVGNEAVALHKRQEQVEKRDVDLPFLSTDESMQQALNDSHIFQGDLNYDAGSVLLDDTKKEIVQTAEFERDTTFENSIVHAPLLADTQDNFRVVLDPDQLHYLQLLYNAKVVLGNEKYTKAVAAYRKYWQGDIFPIRIRRFIDKKRGIDVDDENIRDPHIVYKQFKRDTKMFDELKKGDPNPAVGGLIEERLLQYMSSVLTGNQTEKAAIEKKSHIEFNIYKKIDPIEAFYFIRFRTIDFPELQQQLFGVTDIPLLAKEVNLDARVAAKRRR